MDLESRWIVLSKKTKALISFAVTAKLICVFVFAYSNSGFLTSRLILNPDFPRFYKMLFWGNFIPRCSHDVSTTAKNIIRDVHDFCKWEKIEGLKTSLNQAKERALTATGVSRSAIERIMNQDKVNGKKQQFPRRLRDQLDTFDFGVLRKIVITLYPGKQILSTPNNIQTALQKKLGCGCNSRSQRDRRLGNLLCGNLSNYKLSIYNYQNRKMYREEEN